MKYWVYKESRILGPFDKEGVSGLPGLDSGTLVCAGDPAAGGAWIPAGELGGLTGITAAGAGGLFDEPLSSIGLLDQMQIDSAGLIADEELSGAFAEELFQDASYKKSFADALPSRGPSDVEARMARERIAELTTQLEAMYRHISELEAGQTDLARRLAAKDLALRSHGVVDGAAAPPPPVAAPAPVASYPPPAESAPPTPADGPAKTFLSPAPPPIAGGPRPVAAVPGIMSVPSEWPQAPVVGSFPSFGGGAVIPPPAVSPPAAEIPAPPEASAPQAPLPPMPSFAFAPPPAAAPPAPEPATPLLAPEPQAPEPAAPPRTLSFGKPKSFKVAPTIKSFKVLGADDAVPPGPQNPVPQFKVEPIAAAPAPEIPAIPPPAPLPAAPPPAPAVQAPAPVVPPPAPVVLAPAAPPEPAPLPVLSAFPTAETTIVPNPFTIPSRPPDPTPIAPPPNTLSSVAQPAAAPLPMPDFGSADMAGREPTSAVPATMTRAGGAAAKAEDGAAARFAKPEPAPPTGEVKKPARNNKAFLIGGVVLVTLLVIVGVIFMRQPKDDLKQMTTLDDGKAPIGVGADDGAVAPPPIVKPKIAPPPAAAPAPVPAGPSAEHEAAIALVKDFPLDGGRGTVGRWLQYSYTADPNAGREEWNASSTGDGSMLVEYRLVPGASGGKGALYLFEADANGLVMGKNLEARQMLAGGPPPEPPKAAKKKPAKKAAKKAAPKKRRAAVEEPKEVPLLPLPDSGELRPPAEDDGTFGSDTVNQGI